MKKTLLLLFIPITIAILNSCVKLEDYEDLTIDINTSIPLGDLTISEAKLFELASVDEGGFTYDDNDVMLFKGESGEIDLIGASSLEEILKIANISFPLSFSTSLPSAGDLPMGGEGSSLPSAILPPFTDIVIEKDSSPFSLNLIEGVSILNASISEGELKLSITPVNGVDFSNLIYTINEITKDGIPLSLSTNSSRTIDLRGYKLMPNQDGKISITHEGIITINNSIIANNPSSQNITIESSVNIQDVKIESAKGLFGRQELASIVTEIDLGDNNSTDFFEYIEEFFIADPSISMRVASTIDIPILAQISSIYAISNVNGERVETELKLRDQFGKNKFMITSGVSTITIDNSIFDGESLLSKAINKDMSGLKVEIIPIVNPTVEEDEIPENNSKPNQFNLNSSVSGNLNYNLPLSGYFKNIKIDDEVSMNIGSGDYELNEISVAILAENTFPLDITLSLYTQDVNGNQEALSTQEIVIPAVKNNIQPGTGSIIPGVIDAENVQIIKLDAEATKRFTEAEDIVFKINASSMNPSNHAVMPTISFYKGSYLKLKMVMGAKGEVNMGE